MTWLLIITFVIQRFYFSHHEFLTYLYYWKKSTLKRPGAFTHHDWSKMFQCCCFSPVCYYWQLAAQTGNVWGTPLLGLSLLCFWHYLCIHCAGKTFNFVMQWPPGCRLPVSTKALDVHPIAYVSDSVRPWPICVSPYPCFLRALFLLAWQALGFPLSLCLFLAAKWEIVVDMAKWFTVSFQWGESLRMI